VEAVEAKRRQDEAYNTLMDHINSLDEPAKRGRPSGSKNKTSENGTLPLQEQAEK